MGSRGETDTPGPGESVFAIRFIGKFKFLRKKREKRNSKNFENLFFLLFSLLKAFKGLQGDCKAAAHPAASRRW